MLPLWLYECVLSEGFDDDDDDDEKMVFSEPGLRLDPMKCGNEWIFCFFVFFVQVAREEKERENGNNDRNC